MDASLDILTRKGVVNPFTGIFGGGNVRMFLDNASFVVPEGVVQVRVRMWGAGQSYENGVTGTAGGGFTLKVCDVTPGETIAVTVGKATSSAGGTSSFGAHCSATGGDNRVGGTGVGGDINHQGGAGSGAINTGGGGAASLFGDGDDALAGAEADPYPYKISRGGAGAGARSVTSNQHLCRATLGLTGVEILFEGTGTNVISSTALGSLDSIDMLGTGPGGGAIQSGSYGRPGVNGGGGGGGQIKLGNGGWPGGGGCKGGNGLVIVEW